MRLADFIERDMQRILINWEAFAAMQSPAADNMRTLELRDHAEQILRAVVTDLRKPQTPEAQRTKSMGLAESLFHAPETAAQTHAVLRAKSGFDITQLAAEYRALRASVLRLWTEACRPGEPGMDDVMRFNEAIDQALAESVEFFAAHVEQSRNLLLGMLSHDLRSPLQTIQITAHYLRALDARADVSQAACRLISSGARMQSLLNDLLDFNRTKLGLGIRVSPVQADMATICTEEIDNVCAAHPDRAVELETKGDCSGLWDGGRIQQLLGNLVTNALNYGSPNEAVHVFLDGRATEVRLVVTNAGQIEPDVLPNLFEPLRRGLDRGHKNESGLGLGLYIASEVAKAHGGSIAAASRDSRTVFTVLLPRQRVHEEATV